MGHAAGDGRYLAQVQRTEYDMPHILADGYGSLGYGYGYAFAQDDLCVLATERSPCSANAPNSVRTERRVRRSHRARDQPR